MVFPDINPVIISFGPFAVSWYSLAYVVGILTGWFLAAKIVTKYKTEITSKGLEDFITWLIIGIILGGRLGFVILYDPARYFSDPIKILKTMEGGMSFHGGFIGVVAAGILFCRKYKKNFFGLMDIVAVVAPIGLFLGRLANFVNAELYGRITTVSWGVVFPYAGPFPRHPSQLYEAALEGFVLLLIMLVATFRFDYIKHQGRLSGIFLVYYSIFRIIVEFFREPDIQIGFLASYFTMGQFLSLPMLFFGIYLIYYRKNAN